MSPASLRVPVLLALAIALLALAGACAAQDEPSDAASASDAIRAGFERHPEAYRFAIDAETVVRVAYPSEIIRWSWAAVMTHVPSGSSVELDPQGIVVRTHFQSGAGEAALDRALGDDAVMARVREMLALIGDGVVFDDVAP